MYKNQLFMAFNLFIMVALLVSLAMLLLNPESRTGPFGIGLPAELKTYQSVHHPVRLIYPGSWVVHDATNMMKSRGIIFSINVPGRSFPQVMGYEKPFTTNIEEVIEWGNRIMDDLNYDNISIDNFRATITDGVAISYLKSTRTFFKEYRIFCYNYYFVVDLSGYLISFCSEEQHSSLTDSVFMDMLESVYIEKGI
jgi:hypothetical protein